MSLVQFIHDNSPVTNLPDLLGWHHNNPLGISPLAQLIIIFVLVAVMEAFDYMIRHREKPQYYPVLYALLGVSVVAVFYYCFQNGLPLLTDSVQENQPCIGWFCQPSIVGWPWAIVGLIALTFVIYSLLCAVMQVAAQLSVEAGLIEDKPWKEWKWALFIVLLGCAVVGISYYFNQAVSSWAFLAFNVLLVAFVIFKIVYDCIRCRNIFWSLLIGLTFLIGITATYMLTLECLRGLIFLLVLFMVFFSRAKARKKKKKE